MYMQVLYHLQKVSGKSGWNTTFGVVKGATEHLKR